MNDLLPGLNHLPSWIIEYAKVECADKTPLETIAFINELCAANNIQRVDPRLSGSLTILELCNQREKNLITAYSLYELAYGLLHIDVKLMRQELSLGNAQTVKSTYTALCELGIDHILTDGLDAYTRNYLLNLTGENVCA